jgi:hypothetical protein
MRGSPSFQQRYSSRSPTRQGKSTGEALRVHPAPAQQDDALNHPRLFAPEGTEPFLLFQSRAQQLLQLRQKALGSLQIKDLV